MHGFEDTSTCIMYMYIYMYIHIYICIYLFVIQMAQFIDVFATACYQHTYINTHMYTRVHIYPSVCSLHLSICVCMCMCSYTYTHVCMWICMYIANTTGPNTLQLRTLAPKAMPPMAFGTGVLE